MNTSHQAPALRPSVLALQSALALVAISVVALMASAAQAAAAAEATVADLTSPTSTLEVGVAHASEASAKAQEYTGVRGQGAYAIGNLDLRGGGAYDSNSAFRFRLLGRKLGTDSRSLGAELGVQGRYRLELNYDELRRQRSDSYQTPYLGAGSNSLSLPPTWLVPLVPRLSTVAPAAGTAGGANARGLLSDVTNSSALVSGVLTAPTAAQLATARAIQAADLPLFQPVNLGTQRKRYGVGLTYELSPQWQATASYSQEHRTGLKPMGTVTRYTNADMSTIIPDLIDQNTEQLNLGLTYVGDKLTFNTAYHGSLFVNNVKSVSWANWALPSNTQTMSSAPDNEYHQLSLTASYAVAPSTKLTGNLSYGRATQDQAFLTDVSTPLVPTASLHGLVVTQTAHLKLVSRPVRDLTLAASYKFDDRDNRTPVNTYGYYDAGELKSGTSLFTAYYPGLGLGANANLNANRPYSKRSQQAMLDADYRLAPGQALKAGAEFQHAALSCPGSWIACADASKTDETLLRAEWRFQALDTISGRVALSGAHRTVDYNENAFLALVPAANLSPTGAPGGATAYGTLSALGLSGYGPVLGLNPLPTAGSAQAFFFANNNALANGLYGNQNRISELPGLRRYNLADRKRDKLRTAATWQASDSLTVQGGLDYNHDRYTKSVYGLTSAESWALNLDGTWGPGEDTSVTLFYSFEDQRSQSAGNSYTANSTAANVGGFTAISGGCYATIALRNASNKIDPCLNWAADLRDKVDTLGLNATRKNLLGGKLEVMGSITWSQARSNIGMTGGNYANNPLAVAGAAAGTVAAYYIPAAPLPTVKTETTEFKLSGRYTLSQQSALRVGWTWQHLKASDWAYDGMQFGGLAGVLPSNERAPSYNVHTVGVSYLYSFR